MKNKNQNKKYAVKPTAAIETQLELNVGGTAPMRGAVEQNLEELKAQLIAPHLAEPGNTTPKDSVQRAANEAAGLAWFTPFPMLFFPALLEEKIYAAQRREARQQQIRRQTQDLLDKAVS